MVHKRKKVFGGRIKRTGKDFIEFKTKARAIKFTKQLRSLGSKTSTFSRKGKRVFRF